MRRGSIGGIYNIFSETTQGNKQTKMAPKMRKGDHTSFDHGRCCLGGSFVGTIIYRTGGGEG